MCNEGVHNFPKCPICLECPVPRSTYPFPKALWAVDPVGVVLWLCHVLIIIHVRGVPPGSQSFLAAIMLLHWTRHLTGYAQFSYIRVIVKSFLNEAVWVYCGPHIKTSALFSHGWMACMAKCYSSAQSISLPIYMHEYIFSRILFFSAPLFIIIFHAFFVPQDHGHRSASEILVRIC